MKRLLLVFWIGILFFACNEQETDIAIEDQESIILAPVDECLLETGYADWNGQSMKPGDIREFAVKNYAGHLYEWDYDVSKFELISGLNTHKLKLKAKALASSTCVTVTRKELDSFGTARVKCARTGCFAISKTSIGGGTGGGGTSCNCTSNPYINVTLCVSNGHPYWRFNVTGTGSVNTNNIRWFGSHLTFKGASSATKSVIVEPTDQGYGFRLSVELTDNCGAKRTAFYENYEGGTCYNNTGVRRGVSACSTGGGILPL